VSVPASLRAFLTGIVDYAGLFPPAKLPLEEAIRNYARYRTEPEAWMLGRFVCPVNQLHELRRFQDELFPQSDSFRFSALGTGGENVSTFLAALERDLADIVAFHKDFAGSARVQVYEVKRPDEFFDTTSLDLILSWHRKEADLIKAYPDQGELAWFFEVNPRFVNENSPSQAIQWIRGMDYCGFGGVKRDALGFGVDCPRGVVGLKVRCGGTTAAAFPSAANLATMLSQGGHIHTRSGSLSEWRWLGITLKCTAGLHHPLPHWDAELRVKMHGFINVFGAGMLAEKHELPEKEIQAILEDENPAHFTFTDSAFRWKDLDLATEEIVEMRRTRMTSFGSCSFDDPREDLKRLGWI